MGIPEPKQDLKPGVWSPIKGAAWRLGLQQAPLGVGSPPEKQQCGRDKSCCVCPAHGSLGCAPAGLAGARPRLLVLSLGDSSSVPRVPGGRGTSTADTPLNQPSSCPPLPSELVVLLGTKWPQGPAYSLWLLLPPGPSSPAGARSPRLRPKETCSSLASGLFWLCLCSQLALGPG